MGNHAFRGHRAQHRKRGLFQHRAKAAGRQPGRHFRNDRGRYRGNLEALAKVGINGTRAMSDTTLHDRI